MKLNDRSKTFHLISVIVTTRNEEKNIENCLKGICTQTYPNVEIIVVDNGSSDRTKEIARRYTEKVFDRGPERSAQRNFGVSRAKGSFFLQLDADQIIQPTIIEECIAKVKDFEAKPNKSMNAIALHIPEEIIGGHGWFSKVRNFEKEFYTNTVIDCARFIPIPVFRHVGGYDEKNTGTEDWDLDNKLGAFCEIGIIQTPMLHNEMEMSFSEFRRKKKYYTKGIDAYLSHWKDHPNTRKRLGFYYRFIGVFFRREMVEKILRNPLLFVLLLYTKVIIGWDYLLTRSRAKLS